MIGICRFFLITTLVTAIVSADECKDLQTCPTTILKPINTTIIGDTLANRKAVYFQEPEHRVIPKDFFIKFADVTDAVFESIGIEVLSKDDFINATHLKILKLSHNALTIIPNEVFILAAATLETIELSDNAIREVQPDAFKGLVNLKSLYLNQNSIKTLPENLFSGLKQLQILSLAQNDLEKFSRDDIRNNSELKKISLRSNKIQVFETNSLKNFKKLDFVDLSFNKIDEIHLQSVDTLHLDSSKLTYLFVNDSIARLHVSNNRLKNFKIGNMSNLIELIASNTTFKDFDYIKSAENLHNLDISYNMLDNVKSDFFDSLPELQELNLSGTNLTSLSRWSFLRLTKLTALDISNNGLEKIDLSKLRGLVNLQTLNIVRNNITEWDYKKLNFYFGHFSSVKLGNNKWSCSYLEQMIEYLRSKFIVAKASDGECIDNTGNSSVETVEQLKSAFQESLSEMNRSFNAYKKTQEKIDAEHSAVFGRVYTLVVVLLIITLVLVVYKVLAFVFNHYPRSRDCFPSVWPRYTRSPLNDAEGDL